jgi:hypothetical protein
MSLQAGDLKHLVDSIFEIDSFKSKMGDDKNIVTLSFSCKDKQPAQDLSNFIEKGYNFVLDSDVPAGEQADGTYKVFVEIERDNSVHDNITELLDGVKKLTGHDDLKYRYYKNFKSEQATLENLVNSVPSDPDNYGIVATESNLNNFKNFFNKSYVEEINMNENLLRIKKKYSDALTFEFIDIDTHTNIYESIDGKFDIMGSYPEILFLTKYIGDYNISKYGEKLVFENEDKALVLKRI